MEELNKKRLALLTMEDDEAQEFHTKKTQKKQEVLKSIPVAESVAKSRYKTSTEEDITDTESKNKKVISLDSKVQGSLLQGKCYLKLRVSLESNKDDEENEYMLLKPTHYMLDNPMYQKPKEESEEQKEENRESFGEIH